MIADFLVVAKLTNIGDFLHKIWVLRSNHAEKTGFRSMTEVKQRYVRSDGLGATGTVVTLL